MLRIPKAFAIPMVVVAAFITKGLVTVVLVYIDARLAIRHDRRNAS
jgi:hypothetical protein